MQQHRVLGWRDFPSQTPHKQNAVNKQFWLLFVSLWVWIVLAEMSDDTRYDA